MNRMTALMALALIGGCKKNSTDNAITIQLAPVERRNIVVSAQANGAIEPVNVVEVKSKASGVVTKMPVDIGSVVKTGDLLVQIDARDVQNQYNQAAANLNSARVSEQIAAAQLKRSRELFNQRIITAQENEAATLTYANASSAVVGARTNLDLAKQRLEDATVRAPISGTIIAKTASLGSVITSATSSASGGTTILNMADLTKVRMRAMVNETDIGNIHPGQVATVTVDAYPGRNFLGTVEKIEPQAVVQSSVTMFAVLISLTNMDAALMPGMNGDATMIVSQRINVLAVPNDAIRSTKDLATVAPLLGLNADSIKAIMQRSRAAGRGGAAASGTPGAAGVAAGDRGAGGPGAGAGRDTSQAARAARRAAFAKTGGDTSAAGRAARRAQFGGGTASGAPSGFGGGAGGAAGPAGFSGAGGGTRAVVFTKVAGKWVPSSIRTGASDFDYTEVLNGLKEGDSVALLASATMQANRQSQVQRARAATGGGLQTTTPAAGGGGGGGGRGPGG
ncbi:MAG: efflux RND transporter periplasmic adaptor subunit [Gemmatimonadota bacterium]|nr:efflux RND transporter periplasmic adaptor subunit [Gemmatimonadota bacterium]